MTKFNNLLSSSNVKTLVFAMLTFILFEVVDCRKQTPRKQKKEGDHTTGLIFVTVLFVLCFIPAVLIFLYNVYKDPATPQIVENIMQIAREKAFGNLSTAVSKQKAINKQT
jgi:hypothetical protein